MVGMLRLEPTGQKSNVDAVTKMVAKKYRRFAEELDISALQGLHPSVITGYIGKERVPDISSTRLLTKDTICFHVAFDDSDSDSDSDRRRTGTETDGTSEEK